MADSISERVDDYASVGISLASCDDIRSWSYGEVRKPETINYRTYRAEKDGLFCERIFGPERDYECFCGKYKGIKNKGIICDRCGVKVTHSRERRKRMGHINLAAPVVHIWFFKAVPSRLGNLLAMKASDLERVIYFQEYTVIDPGSTDLTEKQLLTEDDYRQAVEEYGEGSFEAGMGAETVRTLLGQLDLPVLSAQLRTDLAEATSKQKSKEIVRRLRIVELMKDSVNRPEWTVLEVIPVIPPDLRPLVLLESGNFATSDLNDLYRRVINRNNRLKKLLDLHAPEVIIRNEKRMLQQSVDALFDNDRCKRSVLGSSNRPLKSLTDMIKGKQGRFRENLLGKRVDYSARSVIVVGPELKLHQCGLPKKIALELFQPFIIRRLRQMGVVDTIKSAKKMLERKDESIWNILDEVIQGHPVLLNRAPTLHRMGIQAFEPVLVEGNAIKIHPLVCEAFNADFDGDQMAVHLPLSIEAQAEARVLMMSTNNIFSPADGKPIIQPSLDIVLGCYYLTVEREGEKGEGKVFSDLDEVLMAHAEKKVDMHARISVRLDEGRGVKAAEGTVPPKGQRIETTVGRVLFNGQMPEGLPFYNLVLDKGALSDVVAECHKLQGQKKTIEMLDSIKSMGFHYATVAGLSFSSSDLKAPRKKDAVIKKAEGEVEKIERNFRRGIITSGERHNQIVDCWTHATELVGDDLIAELASDTLDGEPYLNPVYLMHASGARGSTLQIRQLAGMRGLMAKPSGRIIENPIKANFREGLPVLEYFSSTHGGRKGLADTALKTAESGYLTRKLADVAQNVVVSMHDCGTVNGITKAVIYKGEKIEVPLSRALTGRVARDNIVDIVTDETIVRESELITPEKAKRVEGLGYEKVRVRSPLTCESERGVCALCYGMDLSTGRLVELGLAVGIMAAQSIGEPGTQLTMRTFHIGGTASRTVEESEIRAERKGVIRYVNLRVVENQRDETVVLNRNGELVLEDKKSRELRRQIVPSGAVIQVEDGAEVEARSVLATWDPHVTPILTERSGRVRFEDIVEDVTMREEIDAGGSRRKVIVEHKGDLHPQIVIESAGGEPLGVYVIPEKAHIEVDEAQEVVAGDLLAKTPREITRTQDITGGLPRVTELFEARKPKDPAIMSEISGIVELGERRRGKRTILVKHETGQEKEHLVPHGKHLVVQKGDFVREGDRLVDGPLVPQDILRISGEEAIQQYLLGEIQGVYRSQNETIDDKHVEIIVSQMMRKVMVTEETGDTAFLPGEMVDKLLFRKENERVVREGGKPAAAKPLLLGVTKAALQSESFISAASFQETTKVLTEAAIAGRKDYLRGLKENVILGHAVPAGTGFDRYLASSVKRLPVPEAEAAAVESSPSGSAGDESEEE